MSAPRRRPLVAGNWKMNTTVPEALILTAAVRQRLDPNPRAEVVLLPPFISLWAVHQLLSGDLRLEVGAQDCFWEQAGAFTGEISAPMLRECCQHVLVGHSERRQLFGDDETAVRRKLEAVLAVGLRPLLAVGETDAERVAGRTQAVLASQVGSALRGLASEELRRCALAYEPVWAIGTGRSADPADIDQAATDLRQLLDELVPGAGSWTRVLYGGSVTSASAPGIFASGSVDGALIGGASLDPEEFCLIVAAAGQATQT
ncbi:MAG TPA: triose-phosphate isomerase [Candidatus Dormibacteraeota bacterium]|nr:triose-phosphate isomerase [Candidatus Dormibacteraeota bacterium]